MNTSIIILLFLISLCMSISSVGVGFLLTTDKPSVGPSAGPSAGPSGGPSGGSSVTPVDCKGSYTDPPCPTGCGKPASTVIKQWVTTTAQAGSGAACPPSTQNKSCPATNPCPVDCEYREKDTYTNCVAIYNTLPGPERLRSNIPQCGADVGRQYKEIEVIKQPQHGGKACPVRGEKRLCSIECKDCVGVLKPLQGPNAKGGYINRWIRFYRRWATSRYQITSPSGPGGKPCPAKDGQKISIINRSRAGVNHDDGTLCGKFIGQPGDATNDDIFGYGKTYRKIVDFDSTVKSYHNVSPGLWCAVHK